jgi:hypothetical protein
MMLVAIDIVLAGDHTGWETPVVTQLPANSPRLIFAIDSAGQS